MDATFTVEHLLGVGSFQCKLKMPVQGFYALCSEDGTLSLFILDTMQWFTDYELDEIMEDVDNWRDGSRITVATTINSKDGDLRNACTNLSGPLIIDWDNKRIRQFVFPSGKYSLRTPLFQKGGVD